MADHILSPDELLEIRLAAELKKRERLTPEQVSDLTELLKDQMHAEALARRAAQRDELLTEIYDIESRIERLRDQHAQLLRALADLDKAQ